MEDGAENPWVLTLRVAVLSQAPGPPPPPLRLIVVSQGGAYFSGDTGGGLSEEHEQPSGGRTFWVGGRAGEQRTGLRERGRRGPGPGSADRVRVSGLHVPLSHCQPWACHLVSPWKEGHSAHLSGSPFPFSSAATSQF